jgi:hypothetical protein
MQFEGNLMIGVAEDDDGFDQVVVLDPGLPATPPVRSIPCHEVPVAVPAVRAAEIKTAMRNAMTTPAASRSRSLTAMPGTGASSRSGRATTSMAG